MPIKKRISFFLQNLDRFDKLFIAVLLLIFLIRLYNFDYPLVNGESQRDYLVGRHIVVYKEFPLTGPCCLFNGAFGLIRNSPLYYYFIAAFLRIYDSILFLGFVNILLQTASIIIIYLFAKKLFGGATALIAVVLFGFSWIAQRQALFMWQPFAMQPFVLLSYLLYLWSFTRKSFRLPLAAVASFLFAATLHNSVYALLPTVIVVTWMALHTLQKPRIYYAVIAVCAAGWLLLLYSPWLYFMVAKNGGSIFSVVHGTVVIPSLSDYAKHTGETLATLFDIFFFQTHAPFVSLEYVLLLTLSILMIVYLRKSYEPTKRRRTIMLLAVIGQFILFASLFKAPIWSFYFTPVLGLLIVVIAEIIHGALSKKFAPKLLQFAIVLLLAKVFSANFAIFNATPPLYIAHQVAAITNAMRNEVVGLQSQQHKKVDNFFSVQFYPKQIESPITTSLIFLAPLEKALNTKLVKVVDTENSLLFPIEKPYLFTVCEVADCLSKFSQEYSSYRVLKIVATQPTFVVYLGCNKCIRKKEE